MLNSKDGFFGKRDEKVRKDVGNIYGMTSSSASSSGAPSSSASSGTANATPSTISSTTASASAADTTRKTQEAMPVMVADEGKGNKLIVGPDIKLKGEINDCDTIIVEGRVEATTDSRVLQIAESGAFAGTVGIDVAEIRGRFQGELTARHKLVIYSTGSVTGKIRYGKIVIEEGGELNGDVSSLAAAKSGASLSPTKGGEADAKGSDYWQDQEGKKGGKAVNA
jgi:cytoskeletal protein CcmA (bactofilin family)